MKVVDIKGGKGLLDNKLARFIKHRKFDDFLDIVEYCLSNQVYDCVELLTEWEAGKAKIQPGDYFEMFSALLPKFSVLYPQNNEILNEASDLARKAIDANAEFHAFIDSYKERYSWFYQSIFMAEHLESIYPDNINPGKVIANYLKTLSSGKLPLEVEALSSEYYYKPEFKLPHNSFLHCLIRQIGEWALEQTDFDIELKQCAASCLNDYLDPENREDRSFDVYEPLLFFANLLRFPRDFYYCWINECMLNHESPWLSSLDKFKTALKALPFGEGNDPLLFNLDYYRSLNSKIKTKFDIFLHDRSNLTKTKFISVHDFLALISRAFNDVFSIDDECSNKLAVLVQVLITNYRHKYCSGCAPFNASNYGIIEAEFLVDAIGLDGVDLILLLATGSYEDGRFSLINSDEERASYIAQSDFFENKQENYLAAFNKSVDEGIGELGVALLSLYIFSRAIIMKGRFGRLPDLLPAVAKALTLPGSKIIKHTLSFVVESTEKYFSDDPVAMASALHFRNFLPQPAELHVLSGSRKEGIGRQLNEQEIKEFFSGNLGAERWGKLSENSRTCLVSAELQWRNSAVEFGFGIKDWSGLVTTYCKPLEGELADRLFRCLCVLSGRKKIETPSKTDSRLALEGAQIICCHAWAVAGGYNTDRDQAS